MLPPRASDFFLSLIDWLQRVHSNEIVFLAKFIRHEIMSHETNRRKSLIFRDKKEQRVTVLRHTRHFYSRLSSDVHLCSQQSKWLKCDS